MVAASLGESVLRSKNTPLLDLYYISLGTGIGSGYVHHGKANDLDLGHIYIGGNHYCEGCRSIGCLNSELESSRLPGLLSEKDIEHVALTLSRAIKLKDMHPEIILILGGGISRRYPGIAHHLERLIPNSVEGTIAPPEAKSAAYAGLHYLAMLCGTKSIMVHTGLNTSQ